MLAAEAGGEAVEPVLARAVSLRLLKVLSSSGTQLGASGGGRRRSSAAGSSSFTFHHLTIYSAVKQTTPGEQTRRLHALCAAALQDKNLLSPSELAIHYQLGGQPLQAAVLFHADADRAARETSPFSTRMAILEQAGACIEQCEPSAQLVRLETKARPAASPSPHFVPGVPHVVMLIELRRAPNSYQDYHILLLALAGLDAPPQHAARAGRADRLHTPPGGAVPARKLRQRARSRQGVGAAPDMPRAKGVSGDVAGARHFSASGTTDTRPVLLV